MTTAYADGVDAVRADGGLVHIRTATPDDLTALTELHDRASDRSLYLRFFSAGRECAHHYLPSLVRPADGDHHTLLALMGDRVVGVAEFERVSAEDAEVALLIDDEQQREGIGTLLIEHLAEAARDDGYRCFVAEALAENLTVLRLFTDLGLPIEHKFDGGSVQVRIQLQIGPGAIAASDRREALADAASLGPVLAPPCAAQHRRVWLRRAHLRGEPALRLDPRRPVGRLAGRPSGGAGPRDRRGAGRERPGRGACVWDPRDPGHGAADVRVRRAG
jgi:GNAT superfamily N-acetyltransferase